MELTIFMKWESIFETILELDLNLAWNWKIRKRKGIGKKCKNLKSYFWKLPKNWFIYVGIRKYIEIIFMLDLVHI